MIKLAYFKNWASAIDIFCLDAEIVGFHQVIATVAHEIELFAVESGVVRVADDGAPGAANRLAANPLPTLANTEKMFFLNTMFSFFNLNLPGVALFGNLFSVVHVFSSVLTWALLLLDARVVVADGAFGTVATLYAKFSLLLRILCGKTSRLWGLTALFVHWTPSAVSP
jgi:hypothetical protein